MAYSYTYQEFLELKEKDYDKVGELWDFGELTELSENIGKCSNLKYLHINMLLLHIFAQ